MPHPITDLRKMLRKTTQTALAAQLGISVGYLNDVLHKRREANELLLAKLGLRAKPTTYERVQSVDQPSE